MSRAVSPVVGVLLLTALAVVIAGVAGVVALDMTPGPDPQQPIGLSASANATSGRIVVVHESGPVVDVREVEVRIAVDGTPLRHQPAVPFYSSRGFASFPSGPFNAAADPRWEIGERASLEVTGTNDPTLSSGTTVQVELYRNDLPLARVETTAR